MRLILPSICLFACSQVNAFVPHYHHRSSLNKVAGGSASVTGATSTTTRKFNRNQHSQDGIALKMALLDDVTTSIKGVLDGAAQPLKLAADGLDGFNQQLFGEFQTALQSTLGEVQTLLVGEEQLQAEVLFYATKLSDTIDQWLLEQNPAAQQIYQQVLSQVQSVASTVGGDVPLTLALSAVVTYFAVTSILTWGQAPPPSQPYPLKRYDPLAAKLYFDNRSIEALSRGLQISLKSLGFGIGLLKDKIE